MKKYEPNDNNAVISDCGRYRYALSRKISHESEKTLCFICLNPSTADAKKDDPTVRRCMRFAQDWGYGGLYIVNLFAWRGTDNNVLLREPESKVGRYCDHYIDKYITACDMTVAAWGAFVSSRKLLWRAEEISARFDKLWALYIIKNGHPLHPLRARGDLDPVEFPGYA